MDKQLGNFIGKFLQYDGTDLGKGNQNFLQIRVQLDVRRPLKRKKQVMFFKIFSYVRFKYERLIFFYFYCGRLGHNDSFCKAKMALDVEIVVIGWDLSLGVQSRRALALSSVWLHKGGEGEKGGNFYGSWAPGNRLWDVRDKSGYANGIDLVLGINLEENSTSSLQWGGNSSTGQV